MGYLPSLRETSYDSYWDGEASPWAYVVDTPKRRKGLQILRDKLEGQILCDLGGSIGALSLFARKCKVKDYIVVDPFLDIEHRGVDPRTKELIIPPSERMRNARFVQDDMLLFSSLLQSDSCSFTINGIDRVIIKSEEYQQRLTEEVVRATKPGGIIFCRLSTIWQYLDKTPQMKKIFNDPSISETYIFEKK